MRMVPWTRKSELTPFRDDVGRTLRRFFDEDTPLSQLLRVAEEHVIPAVDIAESEKQYSVAVELPGMNEKDIEVAVMGNALVISGERKWEEEKKGKGYTHVESRYGKFERRVELPADARFDRDAVTATYKKGVLEVVVPKVEPTPVAKIAVKGS